ncbi:MAG: AMP-binding protein, partial [Planctomycetota bacterium]
MQGDTIGALIGEWAGSHGDAPAIQGLERPPLTYGGLALLVRETAATLRALGVGRGDRVAVVLPNGPRMATTFLSVAAAATCAPLNPEYRAEEFEFYLSDLRASALILASGSDSPAAEVARARKIPIVELTPGRYALSGPGGTGGDDLAGPEDTALILHTSGTTSRPKMVPLSHANLCASARSIRDSLALGPDDRCLNVLPLFHIHGLVCATLGSLAAGGSVACSPGFHPIRFFEWLDLIRPTWFTAVPTMHQAILARVDGHREAVERSRLRFIRSCSSALPPRVLAGMEEAFGAPMVEAYGMTEAAHQMASNPLPPRRRKPGTVGVAAGPEVAIMGPGGELLPPGSSGEIVIRGQNVTRGYEANPEANAGAFTNGWFRTGDQGVLDEEGYLTITGRLKEIINRGGEQIAPREIDEVLLDHPAIAQAVAFAVPDPALGEEVGAAVVRKSDAEVTERELRSFVAVKLASFKVPRHLVFVEEIPKGPTGKLQRIGLAKKLGLPRDESARVVDMEPRSDTEKALASIWSRVLDLDRIGVHARFLDLGGDSILAAQLLAEVRREMGVELGFEEIFEAPTVAEMAKVVEAGRRSGPARISRRADAHTAPVSFHQEWRLHYDSRWPDHPISNRPSSIHLLGPLDTELLERGLGEVIRRHETLRTTVRREGAKWVQQILPPAPVELPLIDLSHLSEKEAREETIRLGLEDARGPMDPGIRPLFRAKIVRLAATEHVLLLTIHHLFFDGWSMSVLVRDLAGCYYALAEGRSAALPELPFQYGDFAHWQRERLEGSRYEDLRASWS